MDVNRQLRDNYNKACKALGVESNPAITKALTLDDDDEAGVVTQFCTDTEIGSAGVRALCAAIMARGVTMKGDPYKDIKSMRFWRANARDAGVAAVAEILKYGREVVALTQLEFMDNGVGPAGCLALGESLMLGANTSLMTLRLDNNPLMGDAGMHELAKGLRTNKTLKKLTVTYSDIGPLGGTSLAEALTNPHSALAHLDVMGNHIGSEGLIPLAASLQGNTSLSELILCDNKIGTSADKEANRRAMMTLGETLLSERSALCRVDMEMNTVEIPDAELLAPAMDPSNEKVQLFKLDDSLPPELFARLCRIGGGKKKGKGKKGKKGKKKKK